MKLSLLIGLLTLPALTMASVTIRTGNNGLPCGISGSIEDRIIECAQVDPTHSTINEWELVTRTKMKQELWKAPSGLLWSDRISEDTTHNMAEKICQEVTADYGLTSKMDFRLPSLRDLKRAVIEGSRDVIEEYWFWTSNVEGKKAHAINTGAFFRNASSKGHDLADRLRDKYYVRCISGKSSFSSKKTWDGLPPDENYKPNQPVVTKTPAPTNTEVVQVPVKPSPTPVQNSANAKYYIETGVAESMTPEWACEKAVESAVKNAQAFCSKWVNGSNALIISLGQCNSVKIIGYRYSASQDVNYRCN